MQQEIEGPEENATFFPARVAKGPESGGGGMGISMNDRPQRGASRPSTRLKAPRNIAWEGIDHLDIFYPAPIAPWMRLIAALALTCGLKLTHLDIPWAFVQSPLNYEVYLRLPLGLDQ